MDKSVEPMPLTPDSVLMVLQIIFEHSFFTKVFNLIYRLEKFYKVRLKFAVRGCIKVTQPTIILRRKIHYIHICKTNLQSIARINNFGESLV